jgi:aminopeptidase-like protein
MTEMLDLIRELWLLKRDIVSDGYDQALNRLAQEVPMIIHEYPTGEPCWTWKIPEKWTCDEAYLETLDGKRIIDVKNHPLHVVSYSLPFEGIVKREELLPHLHTHKRLPTAIPFVFKYYDRDWGLCLPKTIKDSLQEDAYRVMIKTRFEPGTLKVGEIVIPGKSKKSFVLAAHLCHPAMANDDLTGCVVSIDIAKTLLKGKKPYFTYRLLILPETIGSVAYLSHNEDLIPDMVGGLFLEELGVDIPHILQTSFMPNSQPDRCLSSALKGLDASSSQAEYRRVIDNDERQFNSPGVRVPMLSFSRVIYPKESFNYPFPEYHSNFDTPEIVTQQRLETSRDIVLKLLQAWENNQYVVNLFKGEVFCSGYKIWIDYTVNPEGHRRLFEIMERCDGSRTVADIATELQISFQSVWGVVTLLLDRKLVTLSRVPSPTDPIRD